MQRAEDSRMPETSAKSEERAESSAAQISVSIQNSWEQLAFRLSCKREDKQKRLVSGHNTTPCADCGAAGSYNQKT